MPLCELSIQIESMRYPNTENNLISNIYADIPKGAFVSLVGPSGCGKTTFLRIIAGLEKRYHGSVKLNGMSVDRPSTHIQIVFQESRLFPWLRIWENIAFAKSKCHKREKMIHAQYLLDRIGMSDKGDMWPKTLSGGEESRVAFARVLVNPPKVLLMDEPFRDLDLLIKYRMFSEFEEMFFKINPCVLMASHSIEDAVLLGDQIWLLGRGPMHIEQIIPVSAKRPRDPSDKNISNLVADIIREYRKLNTVAV